MSNLPEYQVIYRAVLQGLDLKSMTRAELISHVVGAFKLTPEELADTSTNGKRNVIRSLAGIIINEMLERGLILFDGELYERNSDKPVIVRIERCEEEILKLLTTAPRTREDIVQTLVNIFGTDKTSTEKDDNKLLTYIGQLLKSLVSEKVVDYDGGVYSIAPARVAEIKDREAVVALKADFLALIHSRGGEFFENYFMNLLAQYLIRCGKTVHESYVTGGAADGGIDGVAETTDTLGFRETIMVQTKNRIDVVVETDVRAFYGAVCAAQGSRGIFATTSSFHPSAEAFLNSIDNCVGVDGDKIFTMATDTSYGIIREDGVLIIDRTVIH